MSICYSTSEVPHEVKNNVMKKHSCTNVYTETIMYCECTIFLCQNSKSFLTQVYWKITKNCFYCRRFFSLRVKQRLEQVIVLNLHIGVIHQDTKWFCLSDNHVQCSIIPHRTSDKTLMINFTMRLPLYMCTVPRNWGISDCLCLLNLAGAC